MCGLRGLGLTGSRVQFFFDGLRLWGFGEGGVVGALGGFMWFWRLRVF